MFTSPKNILLALYVGPSCQVAASTKRFLQLITAGSLTQVTAYAIQASSPPFPVLLIAYAINGFGMSLQDAQANGLVANLQSKPEEKMGILHAVYGSSGHF
jgi:MFS family permease